MQNRVLGSSLQPECHISCHSNTCSHNHASTIRSRHFVVMFLAPEILLAALPLGAFCDLGETVESRLRKSMSERLDPRRGT